MDKNLLLPLQWILKLNVLCDFKTLIENSASAVIVVSSNPSVGSLPRTKKKVFLLIIDINWWTIVYCKNSNILTQLKFGAENDEQGSNPTPYPQW